MEPDKSTQPDKAVDSPQITDEQKGLVNHEAEYFKKKFRWGMIWEFVRTIPHYLRVLLEL